MQLIIKYIGYLMSILGFAMAVWGLSAKATAKTMRMDKIESSIYTQAEQQRFADSLLVVFKEIRGDIGSIQQSQQAVISSYNSLRASYSLHLKNDKALTKDDFIMLMNGIQFELKYDTAHRRSNIIIKKLQ